jgi:hypothetical protein
VKTPPLGAHPNFSPAIWQRRLEAARLALSVRLPITPKKATTQPNEACLALSPGLPTTPKKATTQPKAVRLAFSAGLSTTAQKVTTQPNAPLPVLVGDALVASLATSFASKLSAGTGASEHLCFQGIRKPTIGLDAYLRRLRQHFRCDDTCILAAMIYVDRLMGFSAESTVNHLSIHRFLAISLLVSVKYHDDMYRSNEYYAQGIGVGLRELNVLEAEFLKAIHWNLNVSPEEHCNYQQLLAMCA